MKTDAEITTARARGFGADTGKTQSAAAFDAPMELRSADDPYSAAEIVSILRANPRAALEAVREAKIAGHRHDSGRGADEGGSTVRTSIMGHDVGNDYSHGTERAEADLRAAGWILVDG